MTTETLTLNTILSESINKSMTYAEYRNLVTQLVEDKTNTGAIALEDLANYTLLNDRRMKRWDKTIKVTDAMAAQIKSFNKNVIWLVLTESWCGDAAHVMPVINKAAELNPLIDFKVILRDENDALMSRFLTNGGKSIPKLIMLDAESHEVLNTFGPRPSVATQMVTNYKAEHGLLTPEFKEDLQHWYNKDKGQSTLEDLVQLLS